ncbi:putative aminopeptidase [Roseibaca ekhonensis]|jgi:D-aminopeptidase|uniref:Putative aminopeptidase n=1 Tax=Roseinatronobacter ekhonensis TaxID=254356 RepID=A0A3B0MAM4_9RHOB|nr:P1 family peptidase [Roseibaca ekhonensis]SUZ32912.1 putative aminopeptidase [Roseibaca ekhonensis]
MNCPGPRNLISDVAGLRVGHGQDARLLSGATVLVADAPFGAGLHIMGGAPGTRETELLAPDRLVQEVDAIVLSGGSAFGLDAASGVMDGLRAQGRGFAVAGQRVPIVPAAILFDLANGGAKDWEANPYPALGRAALDAASPDFALGSHGAGLGATTATVSGGIGSASWVLDGGATVGALVAANPVGSVTVGQGPHFWAAPFEWNDEFGGLGPAPRADYATPPVTKLAREATTLAIVATDAALTQAQLTRLAIAAHDGMARAIVPSHTQFDGDIVFAVSTGAGARATALDMVGLGHAAATCLARAIARAVFHADPPGHMTQRPYSAAHLPLD